MSVEINWLTDIPLAAGFARLLELTGRASWMFDATHRTAVLSDVERRVLSRITEQAWLELTCELVPAGQPDAENPLDPDQPSAREEGAALFIAKKLEKMGFAVELVAKREGRPLSAPLPDSVLPPSPSLSAVLPT